MHLKAIKVNKGVFLSIFSRKFDDQSTPNVHRFVSMLFYVGIHQVRILVFDNNYQT